jgi:hypothetical protein
MIAAIRRNFFELLTPILFNTWRCKPGSSSGMDWGINLVWPLNCTCCISVLWINNERNRCMHGPPRRFPCEMKLVLCQLSVLGLATTHLPMPVTGCVVANPKISQCQSTRRVFRCVITNPRFLE